MPEIITYPLSIKTDFEKLVAGYALREQLRLAYNQLGAVAANDTERYIKSGKWSLFALRPKIRGGNIFDKLALPLLQEQNRLKLAIRKATYSDQDWEAMRPDEKFAAQLIMFGDRHQLKVLSTKTAIINTSGGVQTDVLEYLKSLSLDNLPITPLIDPTEDFTTYAEVDSGSDITITAGTCSVDTMAGIANSYVSRDYTAGHFGDFEHLFEWTATSSTATGVYCGIWAVCNTPGTIFDFYAGNEAFGVQTRWGYGTGSGIRWRTVLQDYADDSIDLYDHAIGTYYDKVSRSGTTLTHNMYSDAARTTLLDTATTTCGTGTKRYVQAVYSDDDGSDTNTITYSFSNLDLQEAAGGQPTVKRFGGVPYMAINKGVW